MSRLFAFALMLALLFSSSALGEEIFMDDAGLQVTLEPPARVAALSGSLAQIWLLAGGEVACVTQDALEERDLGLEDGVVNAGSLKDPSATHSTGRRCRRRRRRPSPGAPGAGTPRGYCSCGPIPPA